jgi:predicted secreted protein
MARPTGLAVYLIIRWLVIFMLLPWGVKTIWAEDVD